MTVHEHLTQTIRPDSLPSLNYGPRVEQLQERLEELNYPGCVVHNLTNLRYLTGFTGSAGAALITPTQVIVITDGRYTEQIHAELGAARVDAEIHIHSGKPDDLLMTTATKLGLKSLALEANTITWAQLRAIEATDFAGELIPSSNLVEQLRRVKEPEEVVRIRAACAIADTALGEVRHLLGAAVTEREFAYELDTAMKRNGADDVSFETIVATGDNGARPHHRPTNTVIHEGDLVVIDFGALVEGYHSDMTRTIAVGDIGEERQRMFDVVRESQEQGVQTVIAGATGVEVDEVCRKVIRDAGWEEAFSHGTGHGVGLDIHEQPVVSPRSGDTLEPGHVVTVEPGVYLSGLGGVRIEDTVVVTEDGCERLTLATKSPELTAAS